MSYYSLFPLSIQISDSEIYNTIIFIPENNTIFSYVNTLLNLENGIYIVDNNRRDISRCLIKDILPGSAIYITDKKNSINNIEDLKIQQELNFRYYQTQYIFPPRKSEKRSSDNLYPNYESRIFIYDLAILNKQIYLLVKKGNGWSIDIFKTDWIFSSSMQICSRNRNQQHFIGLFVLNENLYLYSESQIFNTEINDGNCLITPIFNANGKIINMGSSTNKATFLITNNGWLSEYFLPEKRLGPNINNIKAVLTSTRNTISVINNNVLNINGTVFLLPDNNDYTINSEARLFSNNEDVFLLLIDGRIYIFKNLIPIVSFYYEKAKQIALTEKDIYVLQEPHSTNQTISSISFEKPIRDYFN